MTGKNCTAIRAIRHPCVYVTVYVISVLHIKIYYNIIIGSICLAGFVVQKTVCGLTLRK